MQELLGHSTMRSTMDVYTQAITPAKSPPQSAVMALVFSPDNDLGECAEQSGIIRPSTW